jgi:hypothetical protein
VVCRGAGYAGALLFYESLYGWEVLMSLENETSLPRGAMAFPGPEAVFSEHQQDLASYLLPLLSVRLDDIRPSDPAWRGFLHVLAPAEPVYGVIGGETPHAHGPLLRPNWIGFTVKDGLYSLAGDPRFFVAHPDNRDLKLQESTRADVLSQRDAAFAMLAAARERYQRDGTLQRVDWDEPGQEPRPLEWVEQYGGPVDALGNWVELGGFPMSFEDCDDGGEVEQYAFPVSPAGHRFHHVVTVPGYCYLPDQPTILLFFEPVEQLALLTFDW